MTVSIDDVRAFARLARVAVSDEEAEALTAELTSIFGYIDIIREINIPEAGAENVHLDIDNVLRDDGEPHAPDMYTEALLSQASRRKDRFVQVKKVLGGAGGDAQ